MCHLFFNDWLISLTAMTFGFISDVTNDRTASFEKLNKIPSYVYAVFSLLFYARIDTWRCPLIGHCKQCWAESEGSDISLINWFFAFGANTNSNVFLVLWVLSNRLFKTMVVLIYSTKKAIFIEILIWHCWKSDNSLVLQKGNKTDTSWTICPVSSIYLLLHIMLNN